MERKTIKKLQRNSAIKYDITSKVLEVTVLTECKDFFEKECKREKIYIQEDSNIAIGNTPRYTIYIYKDINNTKEHILYCVKSSYEDYIKKLKK
ncbi:MAG: hypothetical protein WCT77_03600 [Bacteroidota bacterium]|jgi:hypothetical protein